jgi:hypothetical protein
MVAGAWDGGDVENRHYYAAAQAAIDAIYALSPFPDLLCRNILVRMAAGAFVQPTQPAQAGAGAAGGADGAASAGGATPDDAAADSAGAGESLRLSLPRLSRLVFVLGHVGLRTLCHLDSLALRVKTLRIAAAEQTDRDRAATAAAAAAAGGAKGGKGAAGAAGGKKGGGAPEAGSLEDQLGATAAEDEQEGELLVALTEREMAARSLLAAFVPLLSALVRRYLLSPAPPTPEQAAAAACGAAASAGTAGAASAAAAASAGALHGRTLTLARSALLALCKLCAISGDLCEGALPLLFTLLARSGIASVRSTVATALGDLTYRFPNAVEPYTQHLYARLRDPEAGVRRNALMVLTHLVLNGMVKVKGQVGGIAVCLTDDHPRIAEQARTFFAELAQRGGAPIYNMLPDALTHLSALAAEGSAAAAGAAAAAATAATAGGEGGGAPESRGPGTGAGAVPTVPPAPGAGTGGPAPSLRPFTAADLHAVLRFLVSFIDKDKQAEGLADKLLHRFETTTTGPGAATSAGAPASSLSSSSLSSAAAASGAAAAAAASTAAMWRDAAFCLSLLPLNDRIIRRLAEGVPAYKAALADDGVHEAFQAIIAKAKKAAPGGGAPGAGGAATSAAAAKAAAKAAAADGDDGEAAGAGKGAGSSAASKAELREVVAAWERTVAEVRAGVLEESAADDRAAKVARRAAALAAAEGLAGDFEAQAAELRRKAEEAAASSMAAAGEAGGKAAGGRRGAAKKGVASVVSVGPAAAAGGGGGAASDVGSVGSAGSGVAKRRTSLGIGPDKARAAAAQRRDSVGSVGSVGSEGSVGAADGDSAASGAGAAGGRRGAAAAAGVAAKTGIAGASGRSKAVGPATAAAAAVPAPGRPPKPPQPAPRARKGIVADSSSDDDDDEDAGGADSHSDEDQGPVVRKRGAAAKAPAAKNPAAAKGGR